MTQVTQEHPSVYTDDVAPPPRALKWVIWFFAFVFIASLIGVGVGAYAFRNWTPPRYQVVYSERFPILRVLLPERPDPNTTLPTPVLPANTIPLEDLLGAPVDPSDASAATPDPTVEGDAGLAAEVAIQSTATATLEQPTSTPIPPTNTAIPPTMAQPTPVTEAAEIQTVNISPPPASHRNYGFQYVTQTWNNCGPANVTMSLSYYGWEEPQSYAESYLRGTREDKNVSPNEIVDFVNQQTGVRALYRIGGDMLTLKRLVAANLPVMIELGYAPEGNDWLGHYQTVVGYDDAAQSFYVMDSYIPSDQGLPVSYTELDRNWQQFARTFIVFYPAEREGEVMRLLGTLSTRSEAYQATLETAQQEARANPESGYVWFNLGKAQTRLGNYEAAATAFDQARLKGIPWRMLWYQFEPFEAYFETGRYDDVLALVESNEVTLGGDYVEETFYWQGRVFEAQGDMNAAEAAYRRALAQNSRFIAARTALERVS